MSRPSLLQSCRGDNSAPVPIIICSTLSMPNYFIPLDPPLGFSAAVICLNYERPLWDQEEIAETLELREISGTVLLDTLLANASRGRRYFAIEFDGKNFAGRSALVPTTAELEAYSKKSMGYCRKDLNKSLLSDELRALVPR